MGTPICTLWERAQGADFQLLNCQCAIARRLVLGFIRISEISE